MDRNAHKNKSAAIFINKPHGNVVQDKNARSRIYAASSEPRVLRERADMRYGAPKQHGSQKRKTVEIGVCITPELKAELERLRDQGGKRGNRLSISHVAAQFIAQGVQGHIDMQYGALLQPVIERAIDKRLAARDGRFAALLVRIAYDTGQSRAILTNLLARSAGMSPEILDAILDQAGKRAKAKLARLSPEISELIEIVEAWMRDTPEEGSRNPS